MAFSHGRRTVRTGKVSNDGFRFDRRAILERPVLTALTQRCWLQDCTQSLSRDELRSYGWYNGAAFDGVVGVISDVDRREW
ncbi:hypothetical protein C480_16445 [Natrialba aegyptia DSM 13077]|uniref:Uncharacterized protein n=1 Tax=Natrialba aegyptia DSM 13077 TaxID=1227491 RepID=M0AXV6_9EURY|nr:hypothetical protein C480_16445 [Natrialba aegyptia DSM 13077]